jgi:hypothetical protein
MNCKTITERLKRVAAIVDSWKDENSVPQIERDIALGELRDIYNALLVVEAEEVENETPVAESEDRGEDPDVEVEVVIEESEEDPEATEPKHNDASSFESFYDALDIDALLGLTEETAIADEPKSEVPESEEPKSAVVAEPMPEPESDEPESAVVAEPTPEPEEELCVEEDEVLAIALQEQVLEPVVVPESAHTPEEPKSMGAGLFDLNDIPVRSKSRRKMISLYSDNPIPVQTTAESQKVEVKAVDNAPKVDNAPVEDVTPKANVVASQPQQRLGDTFAEVKTLADQMAKDDNPTTPFNRITALRQAIGLNDKFLMIRDLFGGDAERYEATIDTLDEFEDLDECIIYIVENFRWNPDLEAAKLLVSLIERKLA